jgi:hypothetical protein
METLGERRTVVGQLAERKQLVDDGRVVEVIIFEQPQIDRRGIRDQIQRRRSNQQRRDVRGRPAKPAGATPQPLHQPPPGCSVTRSGVRR